MHPVLPTAHTAVCTRALSCRADPLLRRNCHNGGPAGNTPSYDAASGELVCPYHTYRSSTDIRPVWGSILVNLMSVPALANANLSVPGCWACKDCGMPSLVVPARAPCTSG